MFSKRALRDSVINHRGVKTLVRFPRDISKASMVSHLTTEYNDISQTHGESFTTRTIPEVSSYLNLIDIVGYENPFEEPLRVKVKDSDKILPGFILEFIDKVNLEATRNIFKDYADASDFSFNLDVWVIGSIEFKAVKVSLGRVALCYPLKYNAKSLEDKKLADKGMEQPDDPSPVQPKRSRIIGN